MGYILKPFQADCVDKVYGHMQAGDKDVLLQSPTGSGKSVMGTEFITRSQKKGKKCWFNVNRIELIEQTCKHLYKAGIEFGIVSAEYPSNSSKKVQICSVQTLNRRMHKHEKPDLMIWDECRMIAAKTCDNIYHNNPQAYHIGLDATPERLSGEPLKKYFKKMVLGPTVRWLIDNNHLCDYRYFAPPTVDFSDVRMSRGEYLVSDLDALMNNKKIIGNAIREYKSKALGKRNLVFCHGIEHSQNMCEEFNLAGIPAEHIDGCSTKEHRLGALRRFEQGKTLVLTSVNLVTAGLDIPMIECVTIERKTASRALIGQMWGRGMRTADGKDGLIIFDHVGASQEHGLPDDEYPWTLEGRKSSDKPAVPSVSTCEKCYAAFKPFIRVCPECGHVRQVNSREQDFSHTDDELVEVDREAVRRQQLTEQGMARTHEELVEVGKRRGMKNPHGWAKHIMNARQAKKLRAG